MSTLGDVECFAWFIQDIAGAASFPPLEPLPLTSPSTLYLDTLMVYPIRGCCAYLIPDNMPWQVAPSGLRWDREWCLVNLESGSILDQKQAPRLLLIKPQIHASSGILRVCVHRSLQSQPRLRDVVENSLYGRSEKEASWDVRTRNVRDISNNAIHQVRVYQSPDISSFFTVATGVPCTLARFADPASLLGPSKRHSQTQSPEVTVRYQWSSIIDQPPRNEPTGGMQADKPQSLPVALTENLRANALAISNPACSPKKYCLLCIEEREERGYGWQYARMKTMEITAERQNPEVFRATSPLVRMVWMSSVEHHTYMMPNDGGMLPVHTGQIVLI